MNYFFGVILLLLSALGFAQETIDEMFDDGLIDDYKINPSIDIARLIAGTPNINLELLPIKSISITAGAGFTMGAKLRPYSEIIDGFELYERNIKNGRFIHALLKCFYRERNQYKGYFALGYHQYKNNLKEDSTFSSHYYNSKHIHIGCGVQWLGAHNITYDYYLGLSLSNKTTYSNAIGSNSIQIEEAIGADFILGFKVGYPIK